MTPEAGSAVPSVDVSNLGKSFGRVPALSDVSLTVQGGEFVSLLGASGCGKTTLLRIIAGLETADSGSVWIGGKDVTRTPPYARDVGLVFQSYALFPHKSVAANLNFGLRYRTDLSGPDRKRAIEEALDLVRLRGYGERKPNQLSGGQQQRVALARAIITRPEVLLLDEPLSNLDAKLRDEMRLELRDLQRRLGITFIYVTHDRSEALSMSDRIAVVRGGRIEQIGAPQEVFEHPASAAVADFIGHDNLLRAQLVGWRGDTAEVRLAQGFIVRAFAPATLRGAQDVWLLIRRNAVSLHATAGEAEAGGACSVPGRIGAVLYQGLYCEVGVTLASGEAIRIELPTHLAPDLVPGRDVFVRIPEGGTWLLANQDEGVQ